MTPTGLAQLAPGGMVERVRNEIPLQLEELEKAKTNLEVLVTELLERLDPVLSPLTLNKDPNVRDDVRLSVSKPICETKLAVALAENINAIVSVNQKIRHTITRLQL